MTTDWEAKHALGQPSEEKKEGITRVWVDGCFDMHHYGHANLLRQAAALGDELYVGIHTDEEIVRAKGCEPVMTTEERYEAVRGCKWVTAVAEDMPYAPDPRDIERFKIDLVVHGDDVCVSLDGTDVYAGVRDKFRTVRRTHGISTTDLMNRMLDISEEHEDEASDKQAHELRDSFGHPKADLPHHHPQSKFLTTSRKIQQFSVGNRAATANDTIVYVDGDFDLFHVGHTRFLREAKKLGTFLIVGVHTDEVVSQRKGPNYPVMSLNERVLCALQCRYVDEVILGVPYDVTEDLIEELNVSIVAAGKGNTRQGGDEPYAVPVRLGKFKEIDSGSSLLTRDIVDRVAKRRRELEERNAAKAKKDAAAISGERVAEI